MTPPARRSPSSGAWLLRFGGRHLSPEVMESLLLPIVADLQYEESVASTSALTRLVISLRAYVSLIKALGVHHATQETPPTVNPAIAAARWAIAVPVALVGSLLIQRLGVKFGGYPLYASFGPQDWVVWATKCITTPFMAATFLMAVYWCAPSHKRVAISVASPIVIAWGSVLTAGAFNPAGFHGWLFALGLLSIAGGVVTFVILWRFSRAK